MKRRIVLSLLLLVLLNFCITATFAQASKISYQGKLIDGAVPANGQYDLLFRLYDADTAGTQVDTDQIVENVQVTNGIFTVELSFEAMAFTTFAAKWIEIGVRPWISTGEFTKLLPRQRLTSTPYSFLTDTSRYAFNAGIADNASNAENASNADAVGGTPADQIIKEGDLRLTDMRSPTAGSSNYIQANPSESQSAGFDVLGNAKIRSTLEVFGQTTLRNTFVLGTLTGNGSALTNVDAAKLGTFPASDYSRFKWNVVSGNQQAISNNGYVYDTSSPVEVTLPQTPAVGDIVRVVLTGGGTFLVRPNAGQIVARPEDTSASWVDVGSAVSWETNAMSADGTKHFAAGSGTFIHRSLDSGQTWTQHDLQRTWRTIRATVDGTRVYAIEGLGAASRLYTSLDSGANWTPGTTVASMSSLAISSDGTYVAVTTSPGQIYTSTNSGVSFTPRDISRQWAGIASSSNGLNLVATVNGGQIYTSTDAGVTWTPRESSRNWGRVASSSDGSVLAALTGISGGLFVSTDYGVTWTQRLSLGQNVLGLAISADGRKIAAAVNGGLIYLSSDYGLSWNSPPKIAGWVSIASSADGNVMAAVAFGGGGTPVYLRRSNNFTGGVRGYGSIELIYVGSGKFLVLNSVGTLTFT